MSPSPHSILHFVDTRLDSILKHPDGWGTPFCVENLVLQLLDVRREVTGGRGDDTSASARYVRHLHECLPDSPGALSLAGRLELMDHRSHATERFVEILRSFIANEREVTAPRESQRESHSHD